MMNTRKTRLVDKIVELILSDSGYRNDINAEVEEWLKHRRMLRARRGESTLVRYLVTYIYTAGFRWKRSWEAAGRVKKLARSLSIKNIAGLNKRKLWKCFRNNDKNERLLRTCRTILERDWNVYDYIENLYDSRMEESEDLVNIWIGPKSTDLFLRTMGYFDCYGPDVLLSRFFVRTGLLEYGLRTYNNLDEDFWIHRGYYHDYDDWKTLMGRVYVECTIRMKIAGRMFSLGKNPGILDYVLIRICEENEDENGPCRSSLDNCDSCVISDVCALYQNSS